MEEASPAEGGMIGGDGQGQGGERGPGGRGYGRGRGGRGRGRGRGDGNRGLRGPGGFGRGRGVRGRGRGNRFYPSAPGPVDHAQNSSYNPAVAAPAPVPVSEPEPAAVSVPASDPIQAPQEPVLHLNRVYVGNLPYNVAPNDLKDFMSKAGEVVSADIFGSKPSAIVEFTTEAGAKNAIETLNGTAIEGTDRKLLIREDRSDASGRGRGSRGRGRGRARGRAGRFYRSGPRVQGSALNRQIFVGNLPYNIGWFDLKQIFGEIGEVIRADILKGPDGFSKGMGTVCFVSEELAHQAISKMNEHQLLGRTIHVSLDKYAK